MSKPKVYVTDYEFTNLDYEEAVIAEAGGELIGVQCKREEEVIEKCKDAIGLIVQYAPITRRVMESLPGLKVISRYGVGVDTLEIPAATDLGICVANVPDANLEEVSDHALSLLMACARKIVMLNNQVKAGKWSYKTAIPVHRFQTQKLGLLSFGQIAQKLAVKAAALGLKTLTFDPYLPGAVAQKYGVEPVSLEELLKESDYISVHTPLTKETRHLVSENELKMMKKSAFLINTGRGPIIEESALIRALEEGWIAGAALDVLETEPADPSSPLLTMDNVILTPHAAWYSEESLVETRTKAAQGVAEVVRGFFPKYLVNKGLKDKLPLKELA